MEPALIEMIKLLYGPSFTGLDTAPLITNQESNAILSQLLPHLTQILQISLPQMPLRLRHYCHIREPRPHIHIVTRSTLPFSTLPKFL